MRIEQRARRTAERVRAHGGEVFEVKDLDSIRTALDALDENLPARLVLAGGDGTLQAAATWLAEHRPADRMPELIVLSAGRTNYVAADIGTGAHFCETLETLLTQPPESLHPVARHSLVLEHPSIPRQHGFFLAGAGVDQAIRWIHRRQERIRGPRPLHYSASTTSAIALLLRWLTGRFRFDLPSLDVDASALGRIHSNIRFLLATSLPLDGHFITPYAAHGDGGVRLTTVASPARRLPLRLPRLLRGRFGAAMTPDAGYLSGRCEAFTVRGMAGVTLDGQEFDLDPARALHVRPGPTFRFLRP